MQLLAPMPRLAARQQKAAAAALEVVRGRGLGLHAYAGHARDDISSSERQQGKEAMPGMAGSMY
jgi:hypothetical protein